MVKRKKTGELTALQLQVIDHVPHVFSVYTAGEKFGVAHSVVRYWLRLKAFREAVVAARDVALDLLEGDVYKRAIGNKRKRDVKFHKASDFLAVTLLKTYKTATWGANPDIRIDNRASTLSIKLERRIDREEAAEDADADNKAAANGD